MNFQCNVWDLISQLGTLAVPKSTSNSRYISILIFRLESLQTSSKVGSDSPMRGHQQQTENTLFRDLRDDIPLAVFFSSEIFALHSPVICWFGRKAEPTQSHANPSLFGHTTLPNKQGIDFSRDAPGRGAYADESSRLAWAP
jgi:hypothetical protein